MQLWGPQSAASWGLTRARVGALKGSAATGEGHWGTWEQDAGGKKQPVGGQLGHPGHNGCYKWILGPRPLIKCVEPQQRTMFLHCDGQGGGNWSGPPLEEQDQDPDPSSQDSLLSTSSDASPAVARMSSPASQREVGAALWSRAV